MGSCCLFHFLLVSVLLQVHGSQSLHHTCDANDLEALLAFYNGLDSKGTRLVGWGPNDSCSCCSWTGVSCHLGRVVGLELSNKSFQGVISSSIASLHGLVTLNLSQNSLHGQVPVGLGGLAGLRELDFSGNALSGAFPASSDGDGFPAIQVVNVSSNDFTGRHPTFPSAANLAVLDISSNAFSGSINVTALCAAPVKVLRFSANAFTGEVPDGFSQCKVLTELSLGGNGLVGSLPGDLYDMPQLRMLRLQDNKLSGTIDNIGNLSKLMQIDLSYNMFTGSIPNVFGSLRGLEFLNLAANGFSGTLPDSVSSCPMLRVVSLRNNSLSGEIAIDFSLLPKLNILDVGTNKLSGAMPPGLAQCTELRMLNLARNKLVGEVPQGFKELRSLSYLSLSRNSFINLSSALQVLQNLPKLTSLVLTKNFHEGETMPMYDIKGFKSMQVLVLANCALSGMIPPWLQSLENLNVLDISWNKLNGKIPPWLGNLNNLFYIDLSNNSFSGGLPESFAQMRGLISSNGLSERASTEDPPLFIAKSSSYLSLQYKHASSFPLSLILSNNLLVGPILPGIGHLVKLQVLDLSWNDFSGPIPDGLSNMLNLEVLNLAHNNLSGSIPSSLAKLSFLSNFDVAYNNLAGDIPTGGQFSTFTNEDFLGNPALCLLWNASCSAKAPFVETGNDQRPGTYIVTYIAVEVGFAFGLLTVCNVLLVIRAWRAAYFRIVDKFFDMLYLMTMVHVDRLKRKWENEDRS